MEIYNTEEQQVEALKTWLRKNGPAVGVGVLLGLVVVFGYRQWQQQRYQAKVQRSVDFEQTLKLQATKAKPEAIDALAKQITESKDGSYSVMAWLLLAKQQVEAKKLSEAQVSLEQAQVENKDQVIALIIRERLVRVLLAQSKYDAAGAILESVKGQTGAFAPVFAELKGDLLLAKQDVAGARAAYEQALQDNQSPSPLLQLKLDQLATDTVSAK